MIIVGGRIVGVTAAVVKADKTNNIISGIKLNKKAILPATSAKQRIFSEMM
jgi:hypothetical protein